MESLKKLSVWIIKPTAIRLVALLSIAIFVAEVIVMYLLDTVLHVSPSLEIYVDSLLLIVLLLPVLYSLLSILRTEERKKAEQAEFKKTEAEMKRSYERQILLNNLFQISLQDISLEEILERFFAEITSAPWLGIEEKGAIFLVGEEPDVLLLKAHRKLAKPLKSICAEVPFGQCLCGKAAKTAETVFADHIDERHENRYEGILPHGHYCIPIMSPGKEKVLGVLNLYVKEGQRCREEDESFLIQVVVNVLASVIMRKQAEETLRIEHKRTARLLATLPSVLIGIDRNDQISQWNIAAENVLGIPASDVMGKNFYDCGIKWNWLEILSTINGSVHQRQPVRIDELRFQNSEGKERCLGVSISCIFDGQEKPSEFLLVGRDITDLSLLQAQLVQAQKLESIGQLAAGIAHEINTPMQYVSDNTRFLQDSFNDINELLSKYNVLLKSIEENKNPNGITEDIEKAIVEIDQEYLMVEIPKAISQSLEGIKRVSKIVRAMKEFSHPGQEEKTPVDLNQAIENTITVARNEWKYVADLNTELAPDLPLVPCLVAEFNQAILNMIVNAAHAIADVVGKTSGKKGTITISTKKDGDWVEVRVADTGTGIPEEAQPKIFDPFFTTKEVGKGTGQGLALSHAVVVEKHQGTLSFETEVGKGTTFVIRLPLNTSQS